MLDFLHGVMLTCPLCTFSMASLQWTSLLLVIFTTSISVKAGIQPFEMAYLTYFMKCNNNMVVYTLWLLYLLHGCDSFALTTCQRQLN